MCRGGGGGGGGRLEDTDLSRGLEEIERILHSHACHSSKESEYDCSARIRTHRGSVIELVLHDRNQLFTAYALVLVFTQADFMQCTRINGW